MSIELLKKELPNKQRSIHDLYRFISTRNDDNPNYSIFLGAGCSVSSGIRSARELLKTWRRDVYAALNNNNFDPNSYSDEKACSYLTSEHGSWYDRRNEYSSLFEKKFDLPRQRRMFIEQEVRDKKPSLGYAYLVNLISNQYFRTIFTTNFDDLINEAFYTFSDERPIVCAHDSAIFSITVTSKRPKIIKLHGDYLFDDIKSTIRETESLENNMKSKFIEFAKDYGLIIVGYGGHDRSILEILYYLLKHEEYFKHGLYWCIRKGDSVNEEVRKLLWRDRVYYVEIDGFDELMGELNDKLTKGQLPVQPNVISNKANEIIANFVKSDFLQQSKSSTIQRDLTLLKEQSEFDFINKILGILDKEPTDDSRITNRCDSNNSRREKKMAIKEKALMLKLHEKFAGQYFTEVLKDINGILSDITISKPFLRELQTLRASCCIRLGNRIEAIESYNKLISLDEENPQFLLSASQFMDNIDEKMSFIEKAIALDPYHYVPYYHKAKALIKKYASTIVANNSAETDKILEVIDKGITTDLSQRNSCWYLKIDFLLDHGLDKQKALEQCHDIIETLKKQDPYSYNFVSISSRYNIRKGIAKEDILAQIKTAMDKPCNREDIDWTLLLLRISDELNDKAGIIEIINQQDEYLLKNSDFQFLKGELLATKFGKMTEAIEAIRVSLRLGFNQTKLKQLFAYLIYTGQLDEASDILSNKMGTDTIVEQIDLFEAKKEYNEALYLVQNLRTKQPCSKQWLTQETYLYLKLQQFEKAIKIAKENLEICNFNYPPLVVNYELAKKLTGKKVNKERLIRMQNLADSDDVRAAIAILQDDQESSLNYLKKQYDKDATSKFRILDWIVFDDIRNNPKFKQLFEL